MNTLLAKCSVLLVATLGWCSVAMSETTDKDREDVRSIVKELAKFADFDVYDITASVATEVSGGKPTGTIHTLREVFDIRAGKLMLVKQYLDKSTGDVSSQDTTLTTPERAVFNRQSVLSGKDAAKSNSNRKLSPGTAVIKQAGSWGGDSEFHAVFGMPEKSKPMNGLFIEWLDRAETIKISKKEGGMVTIADQKLGLEIDVDAAARLVEMRRFILSTTTNQPVLQLRKQWKGYRAIGSSSVPMEAIVEYFDEEKLVQQKKYSIKDIKLNAEPETGQFEYVLPVGCFVNDDIRKRSFRVSNFEPDITYDDAVKAIREFSEKIKIKQGEQ